MGSFVSDPQPHRPSSADISRSALVHNTGAELDRCGRPSSERQSGLDQGQGSWGSTRGDVFGIHPLLLPRALTNHPHSQPPFGLKNETTYNRYNFVYLAELCGGLDFRLLCGLPIPLERLEEGKGESCRLITDISRASQALPTSLKI